MRLLVIALAFSLELEAGDLSRALRDPLSYVPGVTLGVAGCLDWSSSQPYFRQGWLESNPRFTQTGARNSVPLPAAEGYRKILLTEVAPVIAAGIAINAFSYWLERRTSRWVGRALRWSTAAAFGSAAFPALRQWQRNVSGTP